MDHAEKSNARQTNSTLPVSLRGSLANNYCELVMKFGKREGHKYINGLILSDDKNLVKLRKGQNIVIGLATERGRYLPDW